MVDPTVRQDQEPPAIPGEVQTIEALQRFGLQEEGARLFEQARAKAALQAVDDCNSANDQVRKTVK